MTRVITRLRAEPNLAQRVDLLEDLVDGLQALMIATPSDKIVDDLVDAHELLLHAIPADDALHRDSHGGNLGIVLHERGIRTGRPNDSRNALPYLESAAGNESLDIDSRIDVGRIAGEVAAWLGDWPVAAKALRRAVALLPMLVPQYLSTSDHARRLAPMFGLVSDAATAVLRAGDPVGALELLEQGRGLLIGRAVDARDGASDELRRIARELAASPDPHVPHQPGQPTEVDRRRALARAWDQELVRIRSLEGFADYLAPPRLADLLPAVTAGPVVTIVVSRFGSNALVLTTAGSVDVVSLPDLTPQLVHDMVENFFQVLPFAELSPQDEVMSAEAQEPLRAVLARLWETVAWPVIKELETSDRVWWVPTGPLAALPLHAAGCDGDSVLDRVVSSYTPTIKLLAASRSRPPRGTNKALLIAVPDAPGLPPLRGTAHEAREVMRRFPDSETVVPGASPAEVLVAVGACDWLHVVCHASSIAADPALSALHLHGGNVTARDVLAAGTPGGRLAYLSACATVLAGTQIADEVIHLGSAFQAAGFRHVVGTLWRVTDGTAARTTELFYETVEAEEDRAPLALLSRLPNERCNVNTKSPGRPSKSRSARQDRRSPLRTVDGSAVGHPLLPPLEGNR
jgi:hypothetical protein